MTRGGMALCYVASFHIHMETKMSKHQPTLAWHPDTGEAQTFNHPDEVPSHFLPHHPEDAKAKARTETKPAAPDKSEPAAIPMSRDEIVKALTDGEIPFKANAKDKTLYALLDAKLREHLLDNDVEIPEGSDVPALLALVKAKSE
jgi:hypothetical protein